MSDDVFVPRNLIDKEREARFTLSSNALAKQSRLTAHMVGFGPAPSWFEPGRRQIHFNNSALPKDRILRAGILRALLYHEVAHVRYTRFRELRQTLCKVSKNQEFYAQVSNIIEDGRIERRMSEDHKGTAGYFRLLLAHFFNADSVMENGIMADLCRRVRTGRYLTDAARDAFAPFDAGIQEAIDAATSEKAWRISADITEALAQGSTNVADLGGLTCNGEDQTSTEDIDPSVVPVVVEVPVPVPVDDEDEESGDEADGSALEDESGEEESDGEDADALGGDDEGSADADADADANDSESDGEVKGGSGVDGNSKTMNTVVEGSDAPRKHEASEVEEVLADLAEAIEEDEAQLESRAMRRVVDRKAAPSTKEAVAARSIAASIESILADAKRHKSLPAKRGRISSSRIAGIVTGGEFASKPQSTPAFEFETHILLDVSGSMWESCGSGGYYRLDFASSAVRAVVAAVERAGLPVKTSLWATEPRRVVNVNKLPCMANSYRLGECMEPGARGPGGGNDEAAALQHVMETPATMKRRLVLFITDGESGYVHPIVAMKKRLQEKHPGTYVVGIGIEMLEAMNLPAFTDEHHVCSAAQLPRVMDRVLRKFASAF